ncbi:MAG: beta-galactosidase [Clostridia bacterium]|nr:beta-galactosidase [Clostridia bacterium]
MRYRQVHLDFHTSPAIKNVGGGFTIEGFEAALKAGHVDSITVFSKCHHGYSYHPTAVNEMHPGLDFDLLGAELEACRRAGVRAPVYISAGLDEKYAVKHPEHLFRSSPDQKIGFDQPGYHLLCFNTPYLDLLLGQIREVMTVYRPVGIFLDICDIRPCRCPFCVASMREKGLDPDDPADVYRHGRQVYFNYARAAEKVIHGIDPSAAIFHNAGRIPFGDREFADCDTHLELESLPTGGWGYDHFPMTASYSRCLGKEYIGMTGKFHTSWGEFGGFKHPNALRYETSLSLALGAGCSVGDQLHPSGRMDPSTYALIGAAYAEAEAKEPFCRGASAVSDIAVLADDYPTGANRILLEKKYLFDVIDRYCDISGYKLVILPDGLTYGAELEEKLRGYLQNGGKILASGSAGSDGDGRFLGLDRLRLIRKNDNKPDYMRPVSPDGFTNGVTEYHMAADSYIFEADSGFEVVSYGVDSYFNRTAEHFCSHRHTPADPATRRPGAVVSDNIGYISWRIFEDYASLGSLHLKELAGLMIDKLLGDERTLTVSGLPDRGIATLMRQGDRLVNHLLFAHTTVRGKNTEVIEDIVPVRDINVTVRSDKRPSSVTLQPQDEPVPFEYKDGRIKYTVPLLYIHQMVVIGY